MRGKMGQKRLRERWFELVETPDVWVERDAPTSMPPDEKLAFDLSVQREPNSQGIRFPPLETEARGTFSCSLRDAAPRSPASSYKPHSPWS